MERTRLANLVNARHPMVRLARQIDWQSFDEHFGVYYRGGKGRPAISTRLMVSLHYLKYTHDLSEEAVLAGWVENPYWQYLSGMEFFEYDLPIDPSSMSRWRSRVGEAGAGELLKETIEAGLRLKIIKPSELRRVNVDTTVQGKHIRFPTDPRLYDRMRQRLVAAARREGLKLRQSYVLGLASACSPSRADTPTPNSGGGRVDAPASYARRSWAGSFGTSSARLLRRAKISGGCSLSLGGSTVKSATIRASFIAFMPQRWSASPRARPTNATSSAAKSPSR
jgi:transposase